MSSFFEITEKLVKLGNIITNDEMSLVDVVYFRDLLETYCYELKLCFSDVINQRFFEAFEQDSEELMKG